MIRARSNLDVQFESFSYRHADEILNANLSVKKEIQKVLGATESVPVKQGEEGLTAKLSEAFRVSGWNGEVPVVEGKHHTQYFDFFKSRVAIEIEFSRYEFIYRDFIRFLAAYNANKIDVGVIITNTREGLNRIKYKSSGPNFERVCDELDWLRPTLTVPLWVIGLK
ncbi:MAG TPA: BglII/BstYI family type II restriction endonuclease [Verrucomicrobiae bacterium]|nr:BglII/BstYI family type II restriction endonuclease [Verrucomicrobiae bacterium]